MSSDAEDLIKQLEELIDVIELPIGPIYRCIRKSLAKIYLESGKKMEGIFNLVESHAVSLRTRMHLRYDRTSKEDRHMLDGSLVQHGSAGVSTILDWLCKMPTEWSLVQVTRAYDPTFRFSVNSSKAATSALHIVRYECGARAQQQPPLCVTVPIKLESRTLAAELHAIVADQQEHLKWGTLSSARYHMLKSKLNLRMKNVVSKLQSEWLRHWSSLLIAPYVDLVEEEAVVSFVDQLLERCALTVDARAHRLLCQLAKAAPFLPEWDLRKGVASCVEAPAAVIKDMGHQLSRFPDAVRLLVVRRQPIILLLDEELELFPWEMLTVLQDHPVSRLPSLHVLYTLYKAHKSRIVGGRLQVDAGLGYYIVNPEQNLPRNEKRLRTFLTQRAPSWKGTFGVAPSSDAFRDVLQHNNMFIYSGHGSGAQFLQGDEIQKLHLRAVPFLFGCSSVSSKHLGGLVEPGGMWHFYHIANCPMVVGNLWSVTDTASDVITVHLLHRLLPQTRDMAMDAEKGEVPPKATECKDPDAPELWRPSGYNWKQEPDLLYAINRSHSSNKHYLATAALVARGLPILIIGKVC
ncbi:hypothetical protein ANN_07976 [Periplaneta americana]|uniref:separase n=1 Tax=Periplaneta americana TaxID=6978 RepID=A0ABQ8T1I5_PERAM|nr:hypothetical protein ANN_07976 [Periplaneta americana]